MGEEEDIEEEYEDIGLTQVQKKAMNTEKLFNEKTKKDKIMETRAKELKALRERLMAGTRDSVMDSFDELNHRKVKKTEVDVRSENAKKFMAMFDKGEIPEGMSASDRITLEKDAELQMMRTRKRGERDFFKKLENGELILPWLVATFLFILAYIAGMILSPILFGVTLLSIAFLAIAIIESCIALYLWACVISLFQLLADRQASSQAWELKPRLNTSYNQSYKGIPTEDR